MRTSEDAHGDPVEALHDTEAESGDEQGLTDLLDLDQQEAAELGVDLDPAAEPEPELD
jgi:hypothetical protein